MAERPPGDFDVSSDGYRDAVEESISFVGADLDFFTQAKADALLELVRHRIGEPTRAPSSTSVAARVRRTVF